MDWMEKYRWMRKKIDRVELEFFFQTRWFQKYGEMEWMEKYR